jgi:hypothetical protein
MMMPGGGILWRRIYALGEPVSGTFKRVCSCRDIGDPDGRVVLQHRDRGLAIRSERNYGPGDAGCRMACAVEVWPIGVLSSHLSTQRETLSPSWSFLLSRCIVATFALEYLIHATSRVPV